MKILEPGHLYKLNSYDGETEIILRFVKKKGDKYPGNKNSYSGTITQEVLRALIERTEYVDLQKPCWQNKIIRLLLIACIWLLEKRHIGKNLLKAKLPFFCHKLPTCKTCGHLACRH